MRKAVLFIAVSLDGYIADQNGKVDWLNGQEPREESEDSYSQFIQTVDTVVMGGRTYRQVAEELAPGQWPYQELASYVVTHREYPPADNIHFTSQNPCELVKELKKQPGKGIWICGGAEVARQLMEKDIIDRYDLSVIPILLGSGIRLFGNGLPPMPLRLTHMEQAGGIARLIYIRW